MDAADHQAEPRPARVGGHEAERRQALEHRLLGPPDAADLEEVVHHPDRVEAGVVRRPNDPRQVGRELRGSRRAT